MKNTLAKHFIWFLGLLFLIGLFSFLTGTLTANAQYGTYSCKYSWTTNDCATINNCTGGGEPSVNCDTYDGIKNDSGPCENNHQNQACIIKKSNGSTCTASEECQSNFCGRESTCSSRLICIQKACALGGTCSDPDYVCVDDGNGDPYGTCELAKQGEGECCLTNLDCSGSLECISGVCSMPSVPACAPCPGGPGSCGSGMSCQVGACIPNNYVGAGEPCDASSGNICNTCEGLVCDSSTWTCKDPNATPPPPPPPPTVPACSTCPGGPGSCGSGMKCDNGMCIPDTYVGIGEPCDAPSGNICNSCAGLKCDTDTWTCVDPSCTPTSCPKGQICTASGTCATGGTKDYGLVPCGGPLYDSNGNIAGQDVDCTLKHVFILIHDVVDFIIFIIAPILATILIVFGGVRILTAGGNAGAVSSGKNLITWAIIGYLVILLSWVIVNTIFTFIGLATWLGPGKWEWWKPTF